MTKRKICVVTGTRAEYGLFLPIMKKIQTSNHLELKIVATTMHFAEELSGKLRNERRPLAASSISDPAHISCTGNDFGYDTIFSSTRKHT